MNSFLERALAKKDKEDKVEIIELGEDLGGIDFKKLNDYDYLDYMDSIQDEKKQSKAIYEASSKLIYKSCSEFKDKELQKAFDIKDPYKIVGKILGIGQTLEVASKLFEKFSGIKAKEKVEEEIKNL